LSVAEAIESGKVKVVAEDPPAGPFGHTGEVLVEHHGEDLLVDEHELEGHVGHGDEVLTRGDTPALKDATRAPHDGTVFQTEGEGRGIPASALPFRPYSPECLEGAFCEHQA
jgi:hypothetical protein